MEQKRQGWWKYTSVQINTRASTFVNRGSGTSPDNEESILHLWCRRLQQKAFLSQWRLFIKFLHPSSTWVSWFRQTTQQHQRSITVRLIQDLCSENNYKKKPPLCAKHSNAANEVVDKLLKCRHRACSLQTLCGNMISNVVKQLFWPLRSLVKHCRQHKHSHHSNTLF